MTHVRMYVAYSTQFAFASLATNIQNANALIISINGHVEWLHANWKII